MHFFDIHWPISDLICLLEWHGMIMLSNPPSKHPLSINHGHIDVASDTPDISHYSRDRQATNLNP